MLIRYTIIMIKIVSEKNRIDSWVLGSSLPFEIVYHDKNGRFKTKDGKWGLLSETGEILIEPVYDAMTTFSNHLALIKKNKKYGYIDDTGQLVIGFDDGEPFLDSAKTFKDGLAEVSLKNEKYYVDYMGHFFEEKEPKVQTLLIKKNPNKKFLILRKKLTDLHHISKKEKFFQKQAEEEEKLTDVQEFLIGIYNEFAKQFSIYENNYCKLLENNKFVTFDTSVQQFVVDLTWFRTHQDDIKNWVKNSDVKKNQRSYKHIKDVLRIEVSDIQAGLPQHLWFSINKDGKDFLYIFRLKKESNLSTYKGKDKEFAIVEDMIIDVTDVT